MIRTQTNTSDPAAKPASGKQIRAPFWSKTPWAGFTKNDHARADALPICPSLRCRRTKACVAAHEEIYCQRTHFSERAFRKLNPQSKAPILVDDDLDVRRERMLMMIEQRREATERMTARWQSGEFDALYGPYEKRGVLMQPPPKVYYEEALSRSRTITSMRSITLPSGTCGRPENTRLPGAISVKRPSSSLKK
jgi:hypothetical protein